MPCREGLVRILGKNQKGTKQQDQAGFSKHATRKAPSAQMHIRSTKDASQARHDTFSEAQSYNLRRTILPAFQRRDRWTQCRDENLGYEISRWGRAGCRKAGRIPSSRLESSARPGNQ